ncbi:hypothetical protein M1523_01720 [Patescibacteria group bacterium]|nr:hypothetical protein [Patescibacteria group bacterium]
MIPVSAEPKIIELRFTYKKDNGDVWVLNLDDVPVDRAVIRDRQLVYLGPGGVGGNHRHPRAASGLSALEIWFLSGRTKPVINTKKR